MKSEQQLRGGSRICGLEARSSPPFPPHPFPLLPPLISRITKIQLGVLGERCELPHTVGSGAEPQPKSNLVHYSLKIPGGAKKRPEHFQVLCSSVIADF